MKYISNAMKFGTQNRSSSLIVEHANYEYNTRQCLECSHDNRLRMIIGAEHGTIIRTVYIIIQWTITVPCSE